MLFRSDTNSDTDGDTDSATDTDTGQDTVPEPDPDAVSRVSGFIDTLPWGQDNIAPYRDDYIDAVIKTCIEFAPPVDDWQVWCQAQLVASSCKESSLNPELVVEDSYGGAADPTVGLTQVRFSSTVQDYNSSGPKDALERIGCPLPDFSGGSDWGSSGPENTSFMQDVRCNLGDREPVR